MTAVTNQQVFGKLASIDKTLDDINRKADILDSLDDRLEDIDRKLTKLDSIDDRLESIGHTLGEINGTLANLVKALRRPVTV